MSQSPRGPSARHERNLERNLGIEDRFDTDASAHAGVVDRVGDDEDLAAQIAREAAQREAARRAYERIEDGSSA